MPAVPYTRTQAERSSDPPACLRASREHASHQEKKREDAAPKPVECIGNCVSIECDGKAYPGFVEDADLAQVCVNCMHSVGKEMQDCFYWPRPFLDLIWYDHDQILAIIPKPHLKPDTTNHFDHNNNSIQYSSHLKIKVDKNCRKSGWFKLFKLNNLNL